jgi:hypothetical protein
MKILALTLLLFLPLAAAPALAGGPPPRTIDDDIAVLDSLCNIDQMDAIEDPQKRVEFLNESYKVIEKHTKELLQTYKEPADRERIYYAMANIYVQTGLIQPERCIYYVEKALGSQPNTVDKAQLHLYWGDALQKLQPRKEAVVPYLRGLKDLLKFNLPAKPPKISLNRGMDTNPGGGSDAKRQADQAILEGLIHQRELVLLRDALREHAANLYAQKSATPGDPVAELEPLAMKLLDDRNETQALVEKTRAAIAAREAEAAAKSQGVRP